MTDSIALLVANSAPLALDTLKEPAQVLNNDSNYASSGQTQFGYKADKSTTYTKIETDGLLSDKASNAALTTKASQNTTYTKVDTDTLLSTKANASDLNSKANVSDVYTKKAVNTLLDAKIDDSDIYPALKLKANATDVYTMVQVNSQLATKTSYTYVDGMLNEKADKHNVYTKVESLQKFAGTQQMAEVLNLLELTAAVGGHTVDLSSKASQIYVDTELANKYDLTYFHTAKRDQQRARQQD